MQVVRKRGRAELFFCFVPIYQNALLSVPFMWLRSYRQEREKRFCSVHTERSDCFSLFFFQVVEKLCEQHNLLFYVCLQQDDIRHRLRKKWWVAWKKRKKQAFVSYQDFRLMMTSWCLMSSDVIWHIRDKLWPMPKHGSIKATYVRCMRV